MRLHLLGSIDVRSPDGEPIPGLVLQPKRALLLAYLAMGAPNGVIRRDSLMALFWPETDERRARKALNQSLHYLRDLFGEQVIHSGGRGQVGFDLTHGWCDVVEFERALDTGRLEDALVLYRGHLMDGFHVSDLVELERWIDSARERLRRRAQQAAWTLADRTLADGDFEHAGRLARSAASFASDFDETALRRLLGTLDQLGDRAGAIREYDRFATRLEEEFGAQPADETAALGARIRAGISIASALGTPTAVEAAAVEAAPVEAAPVVAIVARRPRATWHDGRLVAVAVLAFLVASVLAFQAWSRLGPTPLRSGGVAIFPFSFNGEPESSYLADGVAALISANLADLEGVHSIDPRAVATAGEQVPTGVTSRTAASIARELGAGAYVMGSVTEVGSRIRLEATWYEGGQWGRVSVATAEGEAAELFALVDELTTRLVARRSAGDAGVPIGSAARTTTSPTALRAYAKGEAAYRTGNFAAAVEHLRRAVDIDSTFALAYLRLSNAAHWTGDPDLAARAALHALTFADRLSARDRLHVRAWESFHRGAVTDAERIYRSIVARDSADTEAWQQLGEIAFHWGPAVGRPTVLSRMEWERALALSPQNLGAMLHLARIEAAERRRPAFEDLARRISALAPGQPVTAELHLLRAFSFDADPAQRRHAAERVAELRLPVRRELIYHAAFASHALDGVLELLGPLLELPRPPSLRGAGELTTKAGLALASGRVALAGAFLDSASALQEPNRVLDYRAAVQATPLVGTPQERRQLRGLVAVDPKGVGARLQLALPYRLYVRGVLAALDGDSVSAAAAQARLDVLRVPAGASNADVIDRLNVLLGGERLRAAGRPAEALARLGSPAQHSLPNIWKQHLAHERFLRGELLAELGRYQEALAWFETFPDPSGFDFHYLPAAELWQLRIQLQLGRTAASAGQRRRIVALLAGADAPLRVAPESLLVLLDRP